MARFNRSHSLLISKIYDLPWLIDTYLERNPDNKNNEKTLSYKTIIERFKLLTSDFPHDFEFDTEEFNQDHGEFGEIPYSLIERALKTIITGTLNNSLKMYQVEEQFIPFIQKMFDTFPELDFGEKMTIEQRNSSIRSLAEYFMNCSKIQTEDNHINEQVNLKIEKSVVRIIKNYDGRFDIWPRDYARALIKKHVNIKVIALRKRSPKYFRK